MSKNFKNKIKIIKNYICTQQHRWKWPPVQNTMRKWTWRPRRGRHPAWTATNGSIWRMDAILVLSALIGVHRLHSHRGSTSKRIEWSVPWCSRWRQSECRASRCKVSEKWHELVPHGCPSFGMDAGMGQHLKNKTKFNEKIFKLPSAEIACKRRGAPVSDCMPAPIVEAQQPIRISSGWGTASSAMTSLPIADWPNLSRMNISATEEPNRTAPDKYTIDVVSWAPKVPIGMEREAS